MSKFRPPFTAEYAMQRAMELATLSRIAGRVGRTESLVYKWSDQDSEKKISFENALAVDDLCLEIGGVAPFFEVMKASVGMRGYPPPTRRT